MYIKSAKNQNKIYLDVISNVVQMERDSEVYLIA